MKKVITSLLFLLFMQLVYAQDCSPNAGGPEITLCSPQTEFTLNGNSGDGINPMWTQTAGGTLFIDDPSSPITTVRLNSSGNNDPIPAGDYEFTLTVTCPDGSSNSSVVKVTVLEELPDPDILPHPDNSPSHQVTHCYMVCDQASFMGNPAPGNDHNYMWQVKQLNGNPYPNAHWDVNTDGELEVTNIIGICAAKIEYTICHNELDNCCKTTTLQLCLPDYPNGEEYDLIVPGSSNNVVCSDDFRLEISGVQPCGDHNWSLVSKPSTSSEVSILTPWNPKTFVTVCGTGVYTFQHEFTPADDCPGGMPVIKTIDVLVLPLSIGSGIFANYIFCEEDIEPGQYEICMDLSGISTYSDCDENDCRLDDILEGFTFDWSLNPGSTPEEELDISPIDQMCTNITWDDPNSGQDHLFSLYAYARPQFNLDVLNECFEDFDVSGVCNQEFQFHFHKANPLITHDIDTCAVLPIDICGRHFVEGFLRNLHNLRLIERPNGVPVDETLLFGCIEDIDQVGTYKVEVTFTESGLDPETSLPIECVKIDTVSITVYAEVNVNAGADEVILCSDCAELNGSQPIDIQGNPLNAITSWTCISSNCQGVNIIDPSAQQTIACGLLEGEEYIFRYQAIGCDSSYDDVVKIVDTCEYICDPVLINLQAEISHFDSDPNFDYYEVTGSFYVPEGFEYCDFNEPIKFDPNSTIMQWAPGNPTYSTFVQDGIVTFEGYSQIPSGAGTGEACLILALCDENGDSCIVEVCVEYEVCPQFCTMLPYFTYESNTSDLLVLNVDIYLPYSVQQSCQESQAIVALKYYCGNESSYSFINLYPYDQNPKIFYLPPANSGPLQAQFTINPNNMPPCFFIEVIVPGCDNYSCCNLFCMSEIPVYPYGSGVTSNIEIGKEAGLIEITPNPGNGMVEVVLPHSASGAKSMSIYNASGQLIEMIEINTDDIRIDVSKWESGAYFFYSKDQNGQYHSAKFIRN